MNRLRYRVGAILGVAVAAVAMATPAWAASGTPTAQHSAAVRPASVLLGGVDLDSYCRAIGDKGVTLDGPTAYDWHCRTWQGQPVGISMTDACRWQYNDPAAIDRLGNYWDPYSWQCWH